MKKKGLLWLLASAFMLCLTYTSCDELPEEEDIEEQKQNQNQNQNNDLKGLVAYLPTDYAQKNLAAWYMLTDVKTEKSKVEAVFLFEDSTFVMTIATYYPESANQNPEYIIDATGIYVLAEGGDFDNGKASVIPAKGDPFEVEIKDGKLYAKDEVFTRMTDKLLFSVIDVNNGGDNGNKDVNDVLKYLEARYGNKTVTAYYVCVDAAPGEIRSEAIFLFDDDSMAIAELKVFPEDTEAHPGEFYIHQVGTYELTQGDYTNGVLKLMPKDQNPIVVEIQNGVLHLYNQDYYKDGIIKNNGGDGDDNGGDGDDNGGDGDDNGQVSYDGSAAYLPSKFAKLEVSAWYAFKVSAKEASKTIAAFFFADGSMALTDVEVYNNGNAPSRKILMEAHYELQKQSDFDNGTVSIILSNGNSTPASIVEGKLTLNGETFGKQDNSKLPNPSDANGGDDKPNGDGDDKPNGGDDASGGGADGGDDSGTVQYNGDAVAYLPSDCANKTIAAWYMLKEEKDQSIRVEAVFLFTDNSLVVTKTKVYSVADGRQPEHDIIASGTFTMGERDTYRQGVADVTLSEGGKMQVPINNGVLTAKGENFTIQDNSAAPRPTK